MADETKRIEALHGPYAGQHLDLPAADADQAIADGWARDPFAAASDKPIPDFDAEKHDKMLVAAQKASRKLRGEDEPKDPKDRSDQKEPAAKAKPGKEEPRPFGSEDRASSGSGTDSSSYKTRTSTTPSSPASTTSSSGSKPSKE